MSETTSDLVGQVRDEVGFDVSGDEVILGWLNVKHRRMVARSRCYRRAISLGTLVDGQAEYALGSDVLDVDYVTVNGVPWTKAQPDDIAGLAGGTRRIRGCGGVYAITASSSGDVVSLFPVPDSTMAGQPLGAFGALRAPDLVEGGQAPVTPAEFNDDLVHGAAAIGLRRQDARTADADDWEARFDQACEELRIATSRRHSRGVGQLVPRVG